jgi:tight adherence protein B
MADLWVTALLVFLAGVFGTLSIALTVESAREWLRRRQVNKRLEPVLSGRVRKAKAGDLHDLVRPDKDSESFLTALTHQLPGLRGFDTLLEQARLELSAGTFLILTIGVGFTFGAVAGVLTGSLLVAFLAVAFGSLVPYLFAVARRNKRFKQFEEEFPEAIDLLTRAIRAGHPLSSGIQMVGDEGPPEVAAEFQRVFEEQRFGIPFEEALLGMVDRTNMVDVRIFAIAVLVQREVGGNLAEILENLATVIRKRFYLRRQLRVYTAQGRMTGYVLATLPIVVGLGVFFFDPEYVSLLFEELVGQIMLGTAVALQIMGVFWIRKIINIDF